MLLEEDAVIRLRRHLIAGENHEPVPRAHEGGQLIDEFARQALVLSLAIRLQSHVDENAQILVGQQRG